MTLTEAKALKRGETVEITHPMFRGKTGIVVTCRKCHRHAQTPSGYQWEIWCSGIGKQIVVDHGDMAYIPAKGN